MEFPRHKFSPAGGGICEECVYPKSHEVHIPEPEDEAAEAAVPEPEKIEV